jgi:uncharacterized Zn finger protein
VRPAVFDASPTLLRRFQGLFSARSRSRGVDYAARGRVEIVDANDAWLMAEVQGSDRYQVELDLRGNALHASCTCPLFTGSMEACKHLWATLRLVARRPERQRDTPTSR